MATPWGGIGAWAAEVEREEQEGESVGGSRLPGESTSFPSLKEAAAKPKKKKQVMTLSEFHTGGPPGGSRFSEPKGLTPEEMQRLPTGPRERSDGEEYGRLGGGFKSYGGLRMDDGVGRGGGRWDRRDQADGSWGSGGGGRSYGGFAEERRAAPPRASEPDLPSRADEVDNWSATKKSLGPPPDSFRSNERYGSLGGGASSRADDVDNWNTGKSLARSGGSFGSSFRGPPPESERRRIVLNPPSREAVVNEPPRSRPSPFGAARPREEILADKGLDWRKLESEMDSRRSSRPTSEHSSRPSSAHSSRPDSPLPQPEVVQKPKPKINPFGDAKPREVLLEERGKDWRKIDFELEHRAVDRPETMEEKILRNEINQLKGKLSTDAHVQLNGESDQDSGRLQTLQDLVVKKETELELLVRELDDKVRFGQRGNDRPGSGASRTGVGYLERPSSQSGASEDSRSMEFAERPHSRGGAPDVWSRTDNGRGFRGTKERGFPVNRDADRLKSKERW
ncbi:eukaryotic translation initiation factor 4B2-like [Nymphaea colorata]|nr:eukaryotic translation initiation factor 4B2-like [Nymphaea colorata]XP_031476172.1 eukaryotic translation initiation factor 4B2-like [Nymphaea colorata]